MKYISYIIVVIIVALYGCKREIKFEYIIEGKTHTLKGYGSQTASLDMKAICPNGYHINKYEKNRGCLQAGSYLFQFTCE